MRGDPSPSWLVGIHSGKPIIILGAARGLDSHPELSKLTGNVVIGTNWTLELCDPTYLQIVDANVWNHQAERITTSSSIVICTTSIFGKGSIYSAKSPQVARELGKQKPHQCYFRIKMQEGGYRDPKTGFFHRPMSEPFFVSDPTQPFYFGGNSVCYALQWAEIMGASSAILMGFTLRSGSGYFFMPEGQKPTRHSGIYEVDRALGFVRALEARKPGWAKVVDGWDGPLYDLLPRTSLAAAFSQLGASPSRAVSEAHQTPKVPW
jgi:hypothetical protein